MTNKQRRVSVFGCRGPVIRGFALLVAVLALVDDAQVRASAASAPVPNLATNIQRPLRYRPDGSDFVIDNGGEWFNRPLYGGHTAFRVDGGDKPEFSLYLPGRGGNLRFGVKTKSGTTWLHAMARIETRYRPGELIYDITDPALKTGRIRLCVLAYDHTDGVIVRVAARDVAPGAELIWAYGGASGERGARDGDIGTEKTPISTYFQFRPENTAGDRYVIAGEGFVLKGRNADIAGVMPRGARLHVADGAEWDDAAALLQPPEVASAHPVIVGRARLGLKPLYFSLQRIGRNVAVAPDLAVYRDVRRHADTVRLLALDPVYARAALSGLFRKTETAFSHLRNRVRIETPDPHLNAAMAALNVAADASWDENTHALMHGAIAWRTPLLGWRGPYALDALGWHARARENAATWIKDQNNDPIPPTLPPADETANLARNETGLHSNGDLSASHYDMNAVFIDAWFRHLRWTGDIDEARAFWPAIERHLAWEKRLFRRPFGPEKLPLYEAYAQIWASDNIGYGGGGVAYASAYNYYANRMAARLAARLGKDPKPYDTEAELIARAMRRYLWMADEGAFAEYRNWLGNQMLHPSFGLWSFYHTIDSEVATADEAWRMTAALDRHLKRIPVTGVGVPADAAYHVLPTSDWMPYQWSVNNVVMAENLHAALAYWQAGRREEAFRLAKGALLASLYMGITPGNIGTMNYLDVYRRESQRDFADGAGVMARAMVEGLFGVKPDALEGRLEIMPGFPADWTEARLDHPDLLLHFDRRGLEDRWHVAAKNPAFKTLILRIAMPFATVSAVTVNGRSADWTVETRPSGNYLRLETKAAARADLRIVWAGAQVPREADFVVPPLAPIQAYDWTSPYRGRTESIDLGPYFNDKVTAIFAPGKYRAPRSPFVSLALPAQGIGGWAGEIDATADIDDHGLRAIAKDNGAVALPNGIRLATPPGDGPNIVFTSQWDNYPRAVRITLSGKASHAFLMMAGSTGPMQSRIDNGEVVFHYTDGSTARLALDNPVHWWPIEQDYFLDDYQFDDTGELPPRLDLKTGKLRLIDRAAFKGMSRRIPGGAATVLHLPLDPAKDLSAVTVRALSNDVVIGLMSLTLARP